jgi:hypothetical protein
MGGRGWMTLSVLSGALAVAIFLAVFFASGGRPIAIASAAPLPIPGQPVDTPFIDFGPNPGPAVAPTAAAATAGPTQNPAQTATVSTSAGENNAAPDVSVPPNPFTAGIHLAGARPAPPPH